MAIEQPECLLVLAGEERYQEQAESLAGKLSAEYYAGDPSEIGDALYLYLDAEGLSLRSGDLILRGDLTRMLPRLRPNNLSGELLVKAAKRKSFEGTPLLLDATAGLGEDSLLLAAAGFRVELYEYDPVIAALLADSLRRAAGIPGLSEIAARMELHAGDSIEAMRHRTVSPDVILLDPMFPGRTKSALIKKKFQLLQRLERPCAEEAELLDAAIAAGPKKIIIKRPVKGPYLAGRKPDYSLTGKAIRCDCLVFAR